MGIVSTLIPMYRVSTAEIDEILDRLPEEYGTPLVVLNDQDESIVTYLRSLESKNKLRVNYLPYQVGKLEAVRNGIRVLVENSGTEILVQLDAHLKQPPEEITGLVGRLKESKAGMVVANRYGFQNLVEQPHRATVSGLSAGVINRITGFEIHDVLCGTRAYTRDLAIQFLRLRTFGYGLELEEILIAYLSGAQVKEYPVHSNVQEEATNAEKIEDNLFTLINYAHDVRMSDNSRVLLHFILAKIKQRQSLDVDLADLGIKRCVRFQYTGKAGEMVDGYSSGTATDGYRLELTF